MFKGASGSSCLIYHLFLKAKLTGHRWLTSYIWFCSFNTSLHLWHLVVSIHLNNMPGSCWICGPPSEIWLIWWRRATDWTAGLTTDIIRLKLHGCPWALANMEQCTKGTSIVSYTEGPLSLSDAVRGRKSRHRSKSVNRSPWMHTSIKRWIKGLAVAWPHLVDPFTSACNLPNCWCMSSIHSLLHPPIETIQIYVYVYMCMHMYMYKYMCAWIIIVRIIIINK